MVWQAAIEEGRLKEAGFDATFEWFDDSTATPDVVSCIDGAALVMAGDGARNVMIILADYASDNGMIIGKPGAKTLSELEALACKAPSQERCDGRGPVPAVR